MTIVEMNTQRQHVPPVGTIDAAAFLANIYANASPLWWWMRAATADEQELLAVNAGTTRGHLYQMSNGRRAPSGAQGAAISRESERMHRASAGRLPLLPWCDAARLA